MRILILHDPYKPIVNGSVGGEDNLVQLEIEEFSKMGHQVIDGRVFDTGGKRKFNQIRAQSYGSHSDVLSLIDKLMPDVIHTHNLSQRSGYSWMTDTSTPIVSSVHNYRLFCAASIAWRSGENCFECRDFSPLSAIKNGCDGLRGTLNATRQLLLQPTRPQINKPRLFLTGSEMMNQALAPLIPTHKMRILRNPGLSKSDLSKVKISRRGWLFAGRFVQEKGILDLLRVWPESESLDIAGSGPLEDEIASLIKDRPEIRMIGTFPPGTSDIYYGYKALIFPSTWLEGSPLVIADALSTGTPVIAMASSASREQVELSNAGVVIQDKLTPLNLSDALSDINLNFDKYSLNAIKASTSEFSIENWTKDLSQYLLEATRI